MLAICVKRSNAARKVVAGGGPIPEYSALLFVARLNMTDMIFPIRNRTSRLIFPFFMLIALLCGGCSLGESPEEVAARNQEFDKKLNALNIDVNIADFDKILGQPTSQGQREIITETMKIRRQARPKRVEEKFIFTEYFYVNDYFYVQAVTDEAGKVGMYAITARDARYQPHINTIFNRTVDLGKTVYSDVDATVRKIAVDIGGDSKRPAYYEVMVNTGEDPQIAIMATNPIGVAGKTGEFVVEQGTLFVRWFSLAGDGFPLNEMHKSFRQNTAINTYARAATWFRGLDNSASGANFGEKAINFGPRQGQLK